MPLLDMSTCISMLRGINVSGQKKIRMAELKSLYESLGFTNVQTYIQSGNVVFQSKETDTGEIARKIMGGIQEHFKFTVDVVIRTPGDLKSVLSSNPYSIQGTEDISKLAVTFLPQKPSPAALADLGANRDKSDEFQVSGREIYLFCPHGFARTKFTNNYFERKLKLPATTRNWKTVQRLYAMALVR